MRGREFNPRLCRYQVTTFGKLFTPIKVKELDTVHITYLILKICVP